MSDMLEAMSAAELKACCAVAYDGGWAALLLGESYHPGGRRLTRRLAELLAVRPGERVLDVASGPGTSAIVLAREFGVSVEGIDLGARSVLRARMSASEEGLSGVLRFTVGDAERVPFASGCFDAVVCECSLCTFPDKSTAVSEFARVLRPDGRVGIADVVLDRARLDAELRTLLGWISCLADALPLDGYRELLESKGLRVTQVEEHTGPLGDMIETIDARLTAVEVLGLPALAGLDIERARALAMRAARAVREGIAGYALIVAEAPGAGTP